MRRGFLLVPMNCFLKLSIDYAQDISMLIGVRDGGGRELKKCVFVCAWSTFVEQFKGKLKALGRASCKNCIDISSTMLGEGVFQ